ncbi:hypothetical protein ACFE04_017617 [Oxalis oulophora]
MSSASSPHEEALVAEIEKTFYRSWFSVATLAFGTTTFGTAWYLYELKSNSPNNTKLSLPATCGKLDKYLISDKFRMRIFINYEKRLRLSSPPEKDSPGSLNGGKQNVFVYFASYRSDDGELFMKPADLMRAIVPVFPPSESNIVRNGYLEGERNPGELRCPPSNFFKLFDADNDGLISFKEYIFFLTLLSIPESSFYVAFKMLDKNNKGEIDREEFKKVMALMRAQNRQGACHRHGRRTGLKLNGAVENGGLVPYFFGKDGKTRLQHDKFIQFMRDWHDELLTLEFAHYDYKEQGSISAKDFALSIVAAADISHLRQLLKRVDTINTEPRLSDVRITLEEFKQFAELRDKLEPFSFALFDYKKVKGYLTRGDFQRAASQVCSISLSENVVEIIFHIFDSKKDGKLSADEFVRVLQNRHRDIAQLVKPGLNRLPPSKRFEKTGKKLLISLWGMNSNMDNPEIPEIRILIENHSRRNPNDALAQHVVYRDAYSFINELPKTVSRILNLGSAPTSMDFHPVHRTLLLVGSDVGDVSMWDVNSTEKLYSRTFLSGQVSNTIFSAVKRVTWSPDGHFFGVAYSKDILQLFTYLGRNNISHHIEIVAHCGSINDMSFCNPNQHLVVVTCGDDKTIKVFDVASGQKMLTFEGHMSPVHSVCPHSLGGVWFLFSTSVDGKIKVWQFNTHDSRLDRDTPGRSCLAFVYSSDGRRLYSCGTNEEGESHIFEWNEAEGTIKRTYKGLHQRSSGIIQFDNSKNCILATGHNHSIKFWNMNNPDLLIVIDSDGNLPATPRIRFNKEGTLLAVSGNENKVIIFSTNDGLPLMPTKARQPLIDGSNIVSTSGMLYRRDRAVEETEVLSNGQLASVEIKEPTQCLSLRISTEVATVKITKLRYTNAGTGILALALNGVHLHWKWTQTANGKLFMWSLSTWEEKKRCSLQVPSRTVPTQMTNVKVEFHSDQIHLLVISGALLAIYESSQLECKKQWIAPESTPLITDATFSCNSELIYSCFQDGNLKIFEATNFQLRYQINPTVYILSAVSPPIYPTAIAAHPQDRDRFAVGLSDGAVQVFEPLDFEGRWGLHVLDFVDNLGFRLREVVYG